MQNDDFNTKNGDAIGKLLKICRRSGLTANPSFRKRTQRKNRKIH